MESAPNYLQVNFLLNISHENKAAKQGTRLLIIAGRLELSCERPAVSRILSAKSSVAGISKVNQFVWISRGRSSATYYPPFFMRMCSR